MMTELIIHLNMNNMIHFGYLIRRNRTQWKNQEHTGKMRITAVVKEQRLYRLKVARVSAVAREQRDITTAPDGARGGGGAK